MLPDDFSGSRSFKVIRFNPYFPNVTFLYPLKTSENPRFSDVFRGYRNVTLGEYGLIRLILEAKFGSLKMKKKQQQMFGHAEIENETVKRNVVRKGSNESCVNYDEFVFNS